MEFKNLNNNLREIIDGIINNKSLIYKGEERINVE